ncbi:hypothetical protein Tco_1259002 [Tanacetum coccineum]
MSRIREQVILRSKSNPERGPTLDTMSLGKAQSKDGIEEVFTISQERSDQYVTMGATLATDCKQLLADVVRENMEVFRWLGEGLIRKVLPPKWITNAIPIKLTNGTWKVQMDYYGLNKACGKDMYPLLEEGEELASLLGYPYKCFLQLPKEYNQIRMAEEEEEKAGFHTEEGVYCFTHMPKELKNSATTLQRMMEKVLTDQRGWNVEIYLEVIVIKSKSEPDLVLDVKETLRKLKRVNIKIDLAMSSFGVKEGKEAIEEYLGIRIILVSPEEKMYSYAIRLKFKASNYAIDCEALLAGLAASNNQGLVTINLEYLNQEVSVGIKTRPSVEETSRIKKGKTTNNAPGMKPNCNHEASESNYMDV